MSFGYYIHKDLLDEVQAGHMPLTLMSSSTDEPDIKFTPTSYTGPVIKRHVMRGVNQMRAAILCKMGAGELPSIACSDTPDIVQLPGTEAERYGYFWLLYHKDLRQSARIRAFFKHLAGLQQNWSPDWDTSQHNK
jgi:DNA-binding transcriptional LysR family regulator